jgi:hypothetical protein
MQGPDGGEPDLRNSSGLDVEDGQPQVVNPKVSSVELLRRVILGLIDAIGDGAELVGASVGETLARSRIELERRVVVLLLISAGVLAISVGVTMLLKELIGSWYLTLLVIGAVHIGVGLWLSIRWKREEDST